MAYFSQWLLFILIALQVPLLAHAETNPFQLTHERFVLMSPSEQQQIIIRTMEMMVELESSYEKEERQYGFVQKTYDQYVQALRHVSSFLLSQAHAAGNPDKFPGIAEKFTKLLDSKKEKACVYGGWVSEIKVFTGVNKAGKKYTYKYCQHPAISSPEVKAAYDSSGCKGANTISCNPMVFGYKSSATETPFCVATGFTDAKKNKAHNVSYECMRSALGPAAPGADSKEDRIKYMTAAMSDPKFKPGLESVHKFIFETCACNKSVNIDDYYLKYIRPHRTCFGMFNSLRAINSKECSELADALPKDDQAFMEQWNGFFNDENIRPLGVPKTKGPEAFDKEYAKLINLTAVEKFCSGEKAPAAVKEEPKPEDECGVTITEDDAAKTITATVTFSNEKAVVTDKKWSHSKDLDKDAITVPWDQKATEIVFSAKSGGKDLTCKAEIGDAAAAPEPDPDYKLEVTPDPLTPTSLTLKAKVIPEPKGKKVDIVWTRDGAPTNMPKPAPKVKAQDPVLAADSDAPAEPAPKKAEPTNPDEVGRGPAITEPRINVIYKTCAQLLIDGKPAGGDKQCIPIPPLDLPAGSMQNNQLQRPRMRLNGNVQGVR